MARKTIKNPNPTNYDMSNASYRDINSIVYRENEIWKPINFIPNLQEWYYVSNYGRVYSRFTDSLIKPGNRRDGYLIVLLRTKDNSAIAPVIHRLVMMAHKPIANPDDFHVNHIDGIKTHNIITNLEWVTRSENMLHAYHTGLKNPGEAIHFAILNETIVREICRLLEQNYYPTEISRILNLEGHVSLISEIKRRKNWKHISKDYNF